MEQGQGWAEETVEVLESAAQRALAKALELQQARETELAVEQERQEKEKSEWKKYQQ